MLVLFGLALVVRLAVFWVGIAHADAEGRNPAFLWHDSGQYLAVVPSLLNSGTYTVESDGKQVPYLLRPPAYPLYIAACYTLGGERTAAILIPQLLLGALVSSLAYWIASALFTHRVGLLTGLLIAFDQVLIAYSNKVMSETFSLFFLTGSTALFLLFLIRRRIVFLWCSGLALAIATLAHGSTQYYWIVPIAALAVHGGFSWRDKACATAAFLIPFLLLVGVWVARNSVVYGIRELVPTSNPILFTAARVLANERPDLTFGAISAELAQQAEATFCQQQNIARLDWSEPEMRRRYFPRLSAMRKVEAIRILRAHKKTYARLAMYSLLRMLVLPMPYAELCRFGIAQPLDDKEESLRGKMIQSLKALVKGNGTQFRQAARELPACKVVGFGWNALYWLLTIPAAFVGTVLIIRRKLWLQTILLLGTLFYFTVGTSLLQAGDGMQRYRLRMLPYLYCLAGVCWCRQRPFSISEETPPRFDKLQGTA